VRDGVKREKAHTLHISRRAVVTIMVSRRVFFTLVFFALVARRDADAARPLTEGIDARSLAELEDIVHPTVIWSEIEPLSPAPTRQRDRVVVSAASGVGDVVVAAAFTPLRAPPPPPATMYASSTTSSWSSDVVDADVRASIVRDRLARAFDVSGLSDERLVAALTGNTALTSVLFDPSVAAYLLSIFNGNDGVATSVFG
jgi:hypothetical protein|tara:strand:+ start:30174 stop:30773 length:600 start_codon:yes stop_codon:yes gene_type:complete